jgi:iron complex transport system ATP-binding protein
MIAPILTFDAVTFHYPANHRIVLADLDLTIASGRTTAILGPNGAGKTTLLHLALGWLKPDKGQVLLNGQPLGNYSRRELGRWIGLVPQNEHVAFEYSLLEYTLLGRTPYLHPLAMPGEVDCQVAYWALERVGLALQANKSVLKISGGERQLVLLARTLAQQPRLILMDEPTAHLDLGNKIRLLEIIRALNEEGISIVLTTHEPDFAAATAADVVLMDEGSVQETGPLEQVFTSQAISSLYNSNVKVVDLDGQKLVTWRPHL